MKNFITALVACAAILCGCVALQPGADPLIVRAEQTEKIAMVTFDAFVMIDQANRSLFMTNAPAIHQSAEWLREPVGNPPVPRGILIIESVDEAKRTYRKEKTVRNRDTLSAALLSIESVLNQVQLSLAAAREARP